MDKLVHASDVTIQTATVEVKVLTIGKRQVTLAVFRQLEDAAVIDLETGELSGIPWGRVNYHVECPEVGTMSYRPGQTRHLHVVWQQGANLRRDSVSYFGPRSDKLDQNLDVALVHLLIARWLNGWQPEKRVCEIEARGNEGYARLKIELPNWVWINSNRRDSEYTQRELNEYLRTRMPTLPLEIPAIEEVVAKRVDEMLRYSRNWRNSYAQLEALDQLFIAV